MLGNHMTKLLHLPRHVLHLQPSRQVAVLDRNSSSMRSTLSKHVSCAIFIRRKIARSTFSTSSRRSAFCLAEQAMVLARSKPTTEPTTLLSDPPPAGHGKQQLPDKPKDC